MFLGKSGGGGVWKSQTCNIFNISPVLATFWKKKNISLVSWTWSHETGEMLNVFQKVAKTGGMLNMLNMLNVLGEIGGGRKGQTF